MSSRFLEITLSSFIYSLSYSREKELLERLRFTFTTNGKRESVPRDQVFPLIVDKCLLLQLKNK